MKPKQAYHILTAWYGCVEDEKREKIGEINLLNTIIKGIGRDYYPSEYDLRIVSYHLESEHERINNGKLHTGAVFSYGGAILFLIIMYIPVHIILIVANKLVDLEFPLSYVLGFFVAITAPIYIMNSGSLQKRIISTFNNINRMYLTKKINNLIIEFNKKTN